MGQNGLMLEVAVGGDTINKLDALDIGE